MLGIFTILCIIALVLNIKIYNSVKAGRVLPKFQSNFASRYINLSRKLSPTTYMVLGMIPMFIMLYSSFERSAWGSFIVICAHVYFATRTHKVLDSQVFFAVNEDGTPNPTGGKFLRPATVGETASQAEANAALNRAV